MQCERQKKIPTKNDEDLFDAESFLTYYPQF
jgi:hypothetical protein